MGLVGGVIDPELFTDSNRLACTAYAEDLAINISPVAIIPNRDEVTPLKNGNRWIILVTRGGGVDLKLITLPGAGRIIALTVNTIIVIPDILVVGMPGHDVTAIIKTGDRWAGLGA